jgi:hypothetical protein
VSVDPEKVKAIVEWIRLTSVHEIRSFLEFISYYQCFIKGFSKLSGPLTTLTGRMRAIYGQTLVRRIFRSLREG